MTTDGRTDGQTDRQTDRQTGWRVSVNKRITSKYRALMRTLTSTPLSVHIYSLCSHPLWRLLAMQPSMSARQVHHNRTFERISVLQWCISVLLRQRTTCQRHRHHHQEQRSTWVAIPQCSGVAIPQCSGVAMPQGAAWLPTCCLLSAAIFKPILISISIYQYQYVNININISISIYQYQYTFYSFPMLLLSD